jgi:hypothetical protein
MASLRFETAMTCCRNIETVGILLQIGDPRWCGGVVEREALANLGMLISQETKKLSYSMKQIRKLLAKSTHRS